MKKQKLEVTIEEDNNNNILISNENIKNDIMHVFPLILEPESVTKPSSVLTKKLANNTKTKDLISTCYYTY